MNKPLLSFCLCLLTACSQQGATPAASDVTPQTPVHWQQQSYSAQSVLRQPHWWQAFQDPKLNHLIEQVLTKNNDLAVAALKVKQARLNAGLTATNLTPDVSTSISAIKQKSWQPNTAAEPQGNTPPTMNNMQNNNSAMRYNSSLTLSYEIDLWGKLADERAASNFEAQATEQDRQAAALAMIGTTATLYWKQNYLHDLLNLNQQSLAYTQQSLRIARAHYQAGSVGKLDVLQAEQSVASQQATLESLRQQQEETHNSLAILLDQPPEAEILPPSALPSTALPGIPAGLPADVLAHRPDVQAAELRVRSEYASRQYTRKSYYPTFSLTGALSTSSEALKSVLKNPTGSAGAGLTLPFLEWQTARLNTAKQQVIYEQSVRNFRQTFYSALSEVENQLSARQHYLNSAQQLQQALALAQQTEKITAVRYHAGDIEMQSWLEQQENRRTAEKNLLENHYQQLTTQLALYQALGGDITPTSN
ncbi:efflux transporter outer membrane subunit [Tolumonas lignilytica]|uniref:efflux transporter outer membrane subunit n=1 Tax=Tolumonas lignilytica TaxID=1283284 RepID=UPI00046404C6|nr:efflux transporter outer membrane subunit [Tolumonas lignilytica]